MARRSTKGQAGFVITLELVLIFTILGLGVMAGIVAIRNALFVWAQKKQAQTVWVFDSSDPVKVLGPVRDFDEHEAPRLFFVDRTHPSGNNYRAFIGVRDDRFSGRQRIFYTDATCGADNGTPCIAGPSNEDQDNLGTGSVATVPIDNAGGVGYLYALQPLGTGSGPTYGIGADVDQTFGGYRLPGTLYRQTASTCAAEAIQSQWTSQDVVSGEPCAPRTFSITAALFCPNTNGACNVPPASPLCVVDAGTNQCGCPPSHPVQNGANCCPRGSAELPPPSPPGQCRPVGFFEAEPVMNQDDTANVFAGLTPPFRVNLPPDASDFELLAPGVGEGSPGVPTGVPYDPSVPVDFNVAPTSEQGPP